MLRDCLVNSKSTLLKIDDLNKQQFDEILFNSQEIGSEINDQPHFNNSHSQAPYETNSDYYNRREVQPYPQTQANPFTSQKLLWMTQQQNDLERLLDIKQQAIGELKNKNAQLEMTNAQFYKDSLRKEVEYERAAGQITELAKNMDQKDHKINDLHKRVEELLKTLAQANSISDKRSAEL